MSDFENILQSKDNDFRFDLCVFTAFIRGQLGGNIPVEETRKIWKVLKEELLKEGALEYAKFLWTRNDKRKKEFAKFQEAKSRKNKLTK